MKFRKRDPQMTQLERRLRDEKPQPGDELVAEVVRGSQPRKSAAPRLRLGLAGAVSAVFLAVVVALGGASYPVSAFQTVAGISKSSKSKSSNGVKGKKKSAAKAQYQQKVTICHRGDSPNNRGRTLTIPQQAAQAHLRDHSGDTAGPCPPSS